MRGYPQWRWHLDEVFVKINGKLYYLWRAVDHEGEVLETVVTAKRNKLQRSAVDKRLADGSTIGRRIPISPHFDGESRPCSGFEG
jgi:transposase-like protein